MIKLIDYKGQRYPAFQAEGNASRFAIPFAKQFCQGTGIDVGGGKWPFPGAFVVDKSIHNSGHALHTKFEPGSLDYVFSSHCLEHLDSWVEALDYWTTLIRSGGILFLYLPHYSQDYWRPWNNRKHKHVLDPDVIQDYLIDSGYKRRLVSGVDLNASFTVVAEKG